MTEFNAACALGGLKNIEKALEEKRGIIDRYKEFCDAHGLGYQVTPSGRTATNKDLPVLFLSGEMRDFVKDFLAGQGIETRIYFTPAHTFFEWNEYEKEDIPITEKWYEKSLCLPSWPGVDQEEILRILEEALCQDSMKRKMRFGIE
jgi:dTDP-4-amino-4,6-dideoxygalactose transaminase